MRENFKSAFLTFVLSPRVEAGHVGSAICNEAWGRRV
jgi:hypothetical protein